MGSARLGLCLALAAALAAAPPPRHRRRFDILIRNAHVIDGTGNPWYAADIGIRDGRIAAIGKLAGAWARRTIDARGRIAAPGFFDMHSHSDAALLKNGGCCSKIYEGVTTEVLGETTAVAVAGPLFGPARAQQGRLFEDQGITLDWSSLGQYFARLERQGIRVNVASYATFGAIREAVLGLADRDPTAAELAREERLMAGAMRDGAFGLATGFSYTPDIFAKDPEVIALARVAAGAGGIYASHVRGLDNPRAGGIAEGIAIARAAGLPFHVFHLQVGRRAGPDAAAQALRLIQQARDDGLEVTADAYPYRAAANPAFSMVPKQFLDGGTAALARRLRDPHLRPAIVAGIAASARSLGTPDDPEGWREEFVSSVTRAEDRRYVGLTFEQAGALDHLPPAEAIANLLEREGGSFGRIIFNKSAASVRQIVAAPFVSIGGDAIDMDIADRTGYAAPHPRFFGANTRVLVWARDEHLFTLAEAIRKMTSLADETLHIQDRGLLRPGFAADVVIFDPKAVQDHATYANPWRYSSGMDDVLVNGVPVLLDGRLTAARPGKVIRGPGSVAR